MAKRSRGDDKDRARRRRREAEPAGDQDDEAAEDAHDEGEPQSRKAKRDRSSSARKGSGSSPRSKSSADKARRQRGESRGGGESVRDEERDQHMAIESEVPDDPEAVDDAADRVREILTDEPEQPAELSQRKGSRDSELPKDDTDLNRYVATESELARRRPQADGKAEEEVSTTGRGREGKRRGSSSASRAKRSGSGQRPGAGRGRRSSGERAETRDSGARRASRSSGERKSPRGSGERREQDSGERRGSSARKSAALPARQNPSPAMYAALFGVPVVLLILIFMVAGSKEDGPVRDEKQIETVAKQYFDDGVKAFRQYQRAKQAEDPAARRRHFKDAHDNLDRAMKQYNDLWNAHSSEDEDGVRMAHDGYEYIEQRLQQIGSYTYDLNKDSSVND